MPMIYPTVLILASVWLCSVANVADKTPGLSSTVKRSVHVDDGDAYPTDSLRTNPGALYPFDNSLPATRVYHSVTYIDPFVVIFGGYGSSGSGVNQSSPTYLDDTHIYDSQTQSFTGPISRMACCNDDDELINALGATDEAVRSLPKLRTGFQGDLPMARAEHSATALRGEVFIFGGSTEYGYMNDIYAFSPVSLRWRPVNLILGAPPNRRAGHAVADNGLESFYVFGGRGSDPVDILKDRVVFNDVFRFDVVKNEWRDLVPPAQDRSPAPREHAGMTYINGRLYIFGGENSIVKVLFSDVWAFEIRSQRWIELSPSSGLVEGFAPPPLHSAHLIALDSEIIEKPSQRIRDRFLVYGGVGTGGTCGAGSCTSKGTAFGQIYQFEVDLQKFVQGSTLRFVDSHVAINAKYPDTLESVPLPFEINQIVSSQWRYARIAAEDAQEVPFGRDQSIRGKFMKTFALESVAFAKDRKLLYEFGGLQPAGRDLQMHRQTLRRPEGVDSVAPPIVLDAGGSIEDVPSDLHTGEHLRTSNEIVTSGPWTIQESFKSGSGIKYLKEFRTYRVNPIDLVFMSKEVDLMRS
jgi:hypothetical protein